MLAVAEMIGFGEFRLDSLRRRLLLGDGTPVQGIGDNEFRLLVALIERREDYTGRKELVEIVWTGKTVDEGSLGVALSNLRKALKQHDPTDYISSVPRVGCRFVGALAQEPAADLGKSPALPEPEAMPVPAIAEAGAPVAAPMVARAPVWWRRNHTIGTAAAGLCAVVAVVLYLTMGGRSGAPRLSIVVLPFRALGADDTNAFMADAVTDDLTADLSRIPRSTVIARESAQTMRSRGYSVPSIGERLHVRYLLDGSIREAEGGFHVEAQLVETATQRLLWSKGFDVARGTLADTQTGIVRMIASGLETFLPEFEYGNGARAPGAGARRRPDDADAQTMFYQARMLLERDGSLEGFARAQALLERSVQRQPDWGDALAQLGLTLVLKARSTADPDQDADLRRARVVIGQALRASPPVALALAAQARLNETDGDCRQAIGNATAALRLDGNELDALAVLARCHTNAGQLDRAADYELEALRLNPGSYRDKPRYLLLGQIRLLQGKYTEANALIYQSLAGDEPPEAGADTMGRAEYGRLLLMAGTALSGDVAQARTLYRAYAEIWKNRTVWRIGALSPRALAGLTGFTTFLEGLAQAGMPRAADEHVAGPVGKAGVMLAGSEFDTPPATLAGGATIDTAALAAVLAGKTDARVIDMGRGAAVPPGAELVAFDGRMEQPILDVAGADRMRAIVVMGSGTYGTRSYTAALALVRAGFQHVSWYRGGEEAWTAAGHASSDLRPEY